MIISVDTNTLLGAGLNLIYAVVTFGTALWAWFKAHDAQKIATNGTNSLKPLNSSS